MQDVQLFNQNQLATWDQAREYAIRISMGPIVVGGGVKPETPNSSTSGIYRPDWQAGPGGFVEPNYTDPRTGEKYFFLHYRFNQGQEGVNVGLVIDRFRRYPTSPLYVLSQLTAEVASMR